jgi:hypothetical protein
LSSWTDSIETALHCHAGRSVANIQIYAFERAQRTGTRSKKQGLAAPSTRQPALPPAQTQIETILHTGPQQEDAVLSHQQAAIHIPPHRYVCMGISVEDNTLLCRACNKPTTDRARLRHSSNQSNRLSKDTHTQNHGRFC